MNPDHRRKLADRVNKAAEASLAAMKLFRSWAAAKGLVPKETLYIARTPRRQTLRFSKSGNPTIEQLYRTHWLSGGLSKSKRERLGDAQELMNRGASAAKC